MTRDDLIEKVVVIVGDKAKAEKVIDLVMAEAADIAEHHARYFQGYGATRLVNACQDVESSIRAMMGDNHEGA